ncbi:MAG: hypothetical protein ACLP50_16790 [Solirubrobacteraceae bacterium]
MRHNLGMLRAGSAALLLVLASGVAAANADVSSPSATSGLAATMIQSSDPTVVAPTQPASDGAQSVDPALQSGSLSSSGSLADVSIAASPAGGVTIDGLIMAPHAVSAAAGDATVVNASAAVFGQTETATNTIVRPTAVGAETFQELTDSSAPTDYIWSLTLSASEKLEQINPTTVAVVNTAPLADPEGAASSDSLTAADQSATGDAPASTGGLGEASSDPAAYLAGADVTNVADQASAGDDLIAGAQAAVSDGDVMDVISVPAATDAGGTSLAATLTATPGDDTIDLNLPHGVTNSYPVTADLVVVDAIAQGSYETAGLDSADFGSLTQTPDPISAPVPVGTALPTAGQSALDSTCPAYAAANGTGYWACTVNGADVSAEAPTAAEAAAAAQAASAAQAQAAAAPAENHYGTANCVPSTPYHCYVSNFAEFGVGPFPLGIVHVEENNNLNGRQSQNGAALSLVLRNQPSDAAIRQAWKFHCAVARPSGPRQSCGDITEAIAAFNRVRKTDAQNFLFQIGRFGWSTNTDFYAEYKPGPNPPNQPLGYHVEKVYNDPVICYYAGRRSDPIKRCSYAKFGEQNPILPPGV